ncbi:MAG: DNA-processing protein DprA [Desulfobacterota bacterium]|nr:DNA-processing protein DprA [Thermodesulfobacteriota bacterium]MDW8002408.1 DNA-processing protein DprA [Deltaproteobacteria bacterium]
MDYLRVCLFALSKMKGLSRTEKRRLADEISKKRTGSLKMMEKIVNKEIEKELEKELTYLQKIGSSIVTILDDSYPSILRTIPDAPIVLYVKGKMRYLNETIAIVGSRKASYEGLNLAERVGETLSELGITIVSGLARGIDAQAHRGALKGNGKTVAVLGCGIDVCYPAENRRLYEQISEEGMIFSEYAPGVPPFPYHFPERNRIIAGLSKAILVVEASRKSGALITARLGLDYGRDVMAVPGNVYDESHSGTNLLIKEGARLVTEIGDIIEYSFPHIRPKKESKVELENEELLVFSAIGNESTHVDEIIEKARMDSPKVLAILTRLELKGLIKGFPGGFYLRV